MPASPYPWHGTGERLDDLDLPRIGHRIGVSEDVMHAVLDVESRGRGFDREDRVTCLPEPHIFWRELGAGPLRERAAREGLAYPKWGTRKYPANPYPRLRAMYAIHPEAALRSTSWGLGQVMGFNHQLLGYPSARAMVLDFATNEDVQLEGMVAFIVNAGLDDELRAMDWAGFARGYNGPGYARHGYHTRLAQRFAWWARKPDTPWSPHAPADPAPLPWSPPEDLLAETFQCACWDDGLEDGDPLLAVA